MVLHALHLCSGYGGFELALRLASVPVRTVAHVERDSHAAATLVARMEDQALDRAPVWSDIETFDGGPWHGRVDLVTAGFPCPDFSSAGRRAGVHGDHWLWPECARVVGEVAPRLIFLENVPGLVRLGGLTRVLSDLARLGFDAEWGLLSAAAVGATHQRERFWLLAYADQRGCETEQQLSGRVGPGLQGDVDGSGGPHVGNTSSEGRSTVTGSVGSGEGAVRSSGSDLVDSAGEALGNTDSKGRTLSRRGGARPALTRQSDPGRNLVWPPLPADIEGWAHWISEGGPEPQIRRSTDGRPLGLADALHLGGNGLVPRVAAEAFAELAVRLGIGERLMSGSRP